MEICPAPVSLSPLEIRYKWVETSHAVHCVTKTTVSEWRVGLYFLRSTNSIATMANSVARKEAVYAVVGLSGRRVWGRQQCWQRREGCWWEGLQDSSIKGEGEEGTCPAEHLRGSSTLEISSLKKIQAVRGCLSKEELRIRGFTKGLNIPELKSNSGRSDLRGVCV